MIAVDLDVVSVSVVLIAKIRTLQIRVNFMQVSCCFFVGLMSAFALYAKTTATNINVLLTKGSSPDVKLSQKSSKFESDTLSDSIFPLHISMDLRGIYMQIFLRS